MDLPEKQKEDEIKQFSLEVKADFQTENFSGCFRTRFEKYEYLIKKDNLTKSEQDWIEEYKLTDEYEQIYGEDNKEVFNA